MLRFVAVTVLVLALAACGQADYAAAPTEESSAAYGGMADMDRAQSAGETAPAAPPPPGASTSPSPPQQGGGTNSPVLYMAYSYGLGLELPSQRLSSVMDAHLAACQGAGPRLCQLIGSNRSGDPDSQMSGYIQLRAEPQWLNTFTEGLSAQVDEAGGRITSRTTNSEDLTRQIVDTEARLRALTALRDRLQDLLRSRPGRLADLLEVERELARVQGEIDAIQSNLVVMRTRVSMSELNIQYQSAPRPLGSDTMEPLRQAFADFLRVIVGGFAAIIYIVAGLIPIAVIVIPLIWLALRWRRARGGRFLGPRKASPPPEPTPPT